MKSSSKRLLGIATLLAVILVIFVLTHLPGPSDQDQILAQLETARAAAQHHNVSGIMKVVSADYHGASPYDSNVDQLHLLLVQIVGKNNTPVQVSLAPPAVQVHGDTADTISQVAVRGEQGNTFYDAPVTLHWKKESGTKWLVFSTKVWRVIGAEYQAPGVDLGGLL